jgi:ribosomal protein S27E
MKKLPFTFKKDQYRNARGGYSRFLNLFCESCGSHVALYQKDGPGELRRMYVDRIFVPEVSKNERALICKSCGKILGTFYTYEKEKRPAIRLYQGSIIKKVGRGVYPPQT